MARTRMVTRTINVTEVTAMCVDTTTAQVSNKTLELTGETYDSEKALKACKKLYETDTLKVVSIIALETREEMYGMLETDFLKTATKLDPQTRKMIEVEGE